jgi:NADP-dependent 3-hydroxy acid dehydrogenase YdfG
VGLIARNQKKLAELTKTLDAENIEAYSASADITKLDELADALSVLGRELGQIDVICFSPLPNIKLIKPLLLTDPTEFMESLMLNVAGAAATVNTVLPGMRKRGTGSFIFTTGSAGIKPSHERAASAVTTAAETTYISLLNALLADTEIKVIHTIISGSIGKGEVHEPGTVADHLWQRHTLPKTDNHVSVLG